MPRGKNFTAAEKHFMKKEAAYHKDIKNLTSRLVATEKDLEKMISENKDLKLQIENLTAINNKLMETQNLTAEELKILISKEKNIADMTAMFKTIRNYF